MLVIAENPASQTYVLTNIVRTFLQSFESSAKSLTFISHPKICWNGFNRVIVLAAQSRAVLQTEYL